MRVLISACLLGCRCRYDGESRRCPETEALLNRHTFFPVCPEQLGGLPTPRPPAERRGERFFTVDGGDVTEQYRRGAHEVLRLYRTLDCQAAVLKERSPACGHGLIYDGTFSGTLIPGDGAAAELLLRHGVPVLGETELSRLEDTPNHGTV